MMICIVMLEPVKTEEVWSFIKPKAHSGKRLRDTFSRPWSQLGRDVGRPALAFDSCSVTPSLLRIPGG